MTGQVLRVELDATHDEIGDSMQRKRTSHSRHRKIQQGVFQRDTSHLLKLPSVR